jgi:ribosomal protein S18 acetylase RimI-like enzyme
MMTIRFGALDPRHRGRLAEILTATAAFSTDEIDVALELFDETFEGRGARGEGRATGVAETASAPDALSAPSPLAARPSSYEFIGAYDDADTVTGYACYGPTPGTDRTFDLYWIAVHPTAQGAGEGSELLREVERRLRERGGRLLVVETSSRASYLATRRFYERRGYGEAARVASFYAPSDDRLVYTKRLTPVATSAVTIDSPPPH